MAINLIKELKNKKVTFGQKTAVKQIEKGAVGTIFIAADFPSERAEAIQTKASKAKNKVEVKQLDITTEDLQELCKKPFRISVISVLKEKKKEEKKTKKLKSTEKSAEKTKAKKTKEKPKVKKTLVKTVKEKKPKKKQ